MSDHFVIIILIVSFVDYAGIRFSRPRTINEKFFSREGNHEQAVKISYPVIIWWSVFVEVEVQIISL